MQKFFVKPRSVACKQIFSYYQFHSITSKSWSILQIYY